MCKYVYNYYSFVLYDSCQYTPSVLIMFTYIQVYIVVDICEFTQLMR